jgi:hypothetical protein
VPRSQVLRASVAGGERHVATNFFPSSRGLPSSPRHCRYGHVDLSVRCRINFPQQIGTAAFPRSFQNDRNYRSCSILEPELPLRLVVAVSRRSASGRRFGRLSIAPWSVSASSPIQFACARRKLRSSPRIIIVGLKCGIRCGRDSNSCCSVRKGANGIPRDKPPWMEENLPEAAPKRRTLRFVTKSR